jgi:hypothetical protein
VRRRMERGMYGGTAGSGHGSGPGCAC